MIRLSAFPQCCNGFIISDLYSQKCGGERGMKREVKEQISSLRRGGNSIVCAITTTNQTVAYRVLTELGFQRAGPYYKKKHRDRRVYMWWKPIHESYRTEGDV